MDVEGIMTPSLVGGDVSPALTEDMVIVWTRTQSKFHDTCNKHQDLFWVRHYLKKYIYKISYIVVF